MLVVPLRRLATKVCKCLLSSEYLLTRYIIRAILFQAILHLDLHGARLLMLDTNRARLENAMRQLLLSIPCWHRWHLAALRSLYAKARAQHRLLGVLVVVVVVVQVPILQHLQVGVLRSHARCHVNRVLVTTAAFQVLVLVLVVLGLLLEVA